MYFTTGALREEAARFVAEGDRISALRICTAILDVSPNDFETRLRLADILASLGARAAAEAVYAATTELCIDGGNPLVAIVACRALAHRGRDTKPHIARIARDYARGSAKLADCGARLNPHDTAARVSARALRRELSVQQLVQEAAARGASLDGVGVLPQRFPRDGVLSCLDAEALAATIAAATVRRVPAGHVLCAEGDPGDAFFLLATGSARVTARDDLGAEQELAQLGAGAVFGALSVVTGAPRCATVTASRPCDVIELGPSALAAMGEGLAALGPTLLAVAQSRAVLSLMRSPLLASLAPEQRRELLKHFTAQQVPAGTILFEEGEPSRGIFLLLHGEAMVTRGRFGTRRRVSCVRAGTTLGVGSAVSGEVARASVSTATPATLLFLPTHRLWHVLADAPAASAAMGALAAQRRAC